MTFWCSTALYSDVLAVLAVLLKKFIACTLVLELAVLRVCTVKLEVCVLRCVYWFYCEHRNGCSNLGKLIEKIIYF